MRSKFSKMKRQYYSSRLLHLVNVPIRGGAVPQSRGTRQTSRMKTEVI